MRAHSRVAGAATLRSEEVPRHAVRLLVVGRTSMQLAPFSSLPAQLRSGDLVVVNDAATLPASLSGTADGERFELRLSAPIDANRLTGVLLGAGDHRTPTERRPPPPVLAVGERVRLGELDAIVCEVVGRSVVVSVAGDLDAMWQAIYEAGAPVQYAYRTRPMPLWSVQTAYAARPWSAEMPSAGRPLTWEVLLGLRRAGVQLATLTHAAGLSSTGDEALDRALPWPERYEIPEACAHALEQARSRGGRVIAIGTTVCRALEASGGRAGPGVARVRLDACYEPRVVDGLVSGLHAPGESHFELLSAFASREQLLRAHEVAGAAGLSAHELGDSCLILSASTSRPTRPAS